ncbi:MAG: DUF4340 domain-containing protein [Gemmatimonadaceae bacterium]
MSDRLLKRLAAALVIVVVAWGVLALVRRPPSDRLGSLSLAKVDTAAVDSMTVATARDTMIVARARGARGKWLASGFAADSTAVQSVLKALADTSNITELVAESRTSHERLGVAADSATHVVVFGKGGARVFDLMTGHRTGDYSGIDVRRPSDAAVYALKGLLVDALARAPSDWRDKRILAVLPESVSTIQVEHGGRGYEVKRSGTAWTLGSGKRADSAAVADFLGNFRDLRASGFATRAEADSLDFKKPTATIRLLGKSGSAVADVTVDSAASGEWARTSAGLSVYKLDSFVWSRLAPAESTLVPKPKKT